MPRQAGPRMTDILGIKEAQRQSEQVIDSYAFDKEIYRDIYEMSQPIQDTVAEGDAIIKTYPDLAQDIFMSLYKHKPNLLEKEDVKDTHQFNHKIMEQLMENEDFRRLRAKTRFDMINSALGFEVMSSQAVKILQDYEERMKQKQEQQGGGQTPFEQINEQVEQNGGSGAPGGQGQGEEPGDMPVPGGGGSGGGMDAENAKDQANQQPQPPQGQSQPSPMNEQEMQDALNQMQNALSKAAQDAMDDVSEVSDFLQGWGLDGGDPNNRITFDDKKAALQRLRNSYKIKEMTDIVGRMKKLAINEQKEKAPEGSEAIKSVKTGNKIESVLPSEKATLASKNKGLKRGFYRKYQDKELLEYDMDVYESMGKGPMICCVDTSGSMSGEAEKWSKAVALALLEIANKQKRNYACMHYDHALRHVWEIPHGQLRPETVFDIAEKFSCGGTNFEPPLRKAMEIMENSKFAKGDIVFITDGECMVSDRFLEEFKKLKKEKEFNVYTVLINMGGYGTSRSGVQEFSDKIINVSDLATSGTQGAKDIFRNV